MKKIQLKSQPRLHATNQHDYLGRQIWNNDALRIGDLILRVDGPIERDGTTCRVEAMVHAAPGGTRHPLFGTDITLEWTDNGQP